MNRESLISKIQTIFQGTKFKDDNLELARKGLLETYKKLKAGDDFNLCAKDAWIDLTSFDVVFSRELNKKAKDGKKILPRTEFVEFHYKHRELKKLLSEIETYMQ